MRLQTKESGSICLPFSPFFCSLRATCAQPSDDSERAALTASGSGIFGFLGVFMNDASDTAASLHDVVHPKWTSFLADAEFQKYRMMVGSRLTSLPIWIIEGEACLRHTIRSCNRHCILLLNEWSRSQLIQRLLGREGLWNRRRLSSVLSLPLNKKGKPDKQKKNRIQFFLFVF